MRRFTLALVLALSAVAGPALGASPVPQAQETKSDDVVSTLEGLYHKAAERVAPLVVALKVEREPEAPKAAPKPPAGRPGPVRPGLELEDVFAKRPAEGWCTGTIVEAGGIIVTTAFNVSGKVKSIKVLLPDGREFAASVLGSDASNDLAALKIEADGLPVPRKARLEDLKAGNAVAALGRAPDGKGLTLNPGIVSAASRLAGRGIQTDAKLNFGNVGGPLVDLEGRLIAVTCKVDTKYASTRGQNSGVGFAITHDRLFSEILPELKAGRNVAESRKPFLGIEMNLKSSVEGVELASVQPGGAAEKAGLKAGDVIVEFDGAKVGYSEELRAAIMRRQPGDHVKVKVKRGDEVKEFDCELGWAPGE